MQLLRRLPRGWYKCKAPTSGDKLPWHMKPGMTRWNPDPLKCSGLPDCPIPFSPVHKHLKFSTVLGTVSAYSSNTILPAGAPPMVMSKNTFGFAIVSLFVCSALMFQQMGNSGAVESQKRFRNVSKWGCRNVLACRI